MNKKITSIFLLLLVVISATILFVSFKQTDSGEDGSNIPSSDDITQDDISKELDDFLVPEDDEVDIGEMI